MPNLKLVNTEPEPPWMTGLVEPDHAFELLEAIIENTPECIKLISADGRLLYMNRAGLDAAGVENLEDIRGCVALNAVAPDSRTDWTHFHERVVAGERLGCEYDIVRPNGERRHMETRGAPLRLSDGRIVELGLTRDVTERRRAQDAQRRLVDELNHRVKNTLATIQSITKQTLKRSGSLEEFAKSFEDRLMALAKAHDLLTQSQWVGASLRAILELELAPYPETEVSLRGPEVELPPTAAPALSIVFHELATNAAKYGALSVPSGRVEVDWRCELGQGQGAVLHLQWSERGGPQVGPPAKQGFGLCVIARIVERDLDGRLELDFAPSGFRCRMAVPVGRSACGPP
jgi:PAS domain S-box-containing protein